MSAQEQWKLIYRRAQSAKRQGDMAGHYKLLAEMRIFRYEAALERRVARLERENARLTELLDTAYRDA